MHYFPDFKQTILTKQMLTIEPKRKYSSVVAQLSLFLEGVGSIRTHGGNFPAPWADPRGDLV